VKEDLACSPTKFKPLLEIFLNGCYLGLQNTAVQQNLFPNGVSDYDAIYLTFIGRLPTSSEESILDDLVASLDSADKQMAGVCSAVASSLESVTNM
jgi:hypothetical protein